VSDAGASIKVGLVSARYATALFELARDKGVLPAVQADVDELARQLATPAGTQLFDGRVPHEQKVARITALAAKLQPLTANFLKLLLEKRRLEVLRELPAAFRRSSLAERGAVEGVVESPRPLGQGELAEISVAAKSLLGKDVLLTARTNPDLIAGVRVLVDNRLIDQSALGRLEGLRGKLMHARLS
jgi:F-type H+-transporting ATPase subunit delta